MKNIRSCQFLQLMLISQQKHQKYYYATPQKQSSNRRPAACILEQIENKQKRQKVINGQKVERQLNQDIYSYTSFNQIKQCEHIKRRASMLPCKFKYRKNINNNCFSFALICQSKTCMINKYCFYTLDILVTSGGGHQINVIWWTHSSHERHLSGSGCDQYQHQTSYI